MKKLFIVLSLCAIMVAPVTEVLAKGGGGGHSGGGRSAPSSRPAPAKPSTPTKTITSTPPKTVTATKQVTSASGKKMSGTGTVVGDNYKPSFRGGYSAPAGSVVYYPQRSFIDYLPWIFLFSQNSGSHRDVVVQEPDGKEVTQQEEGIDTMYIWNWVFSIAILGGLIYLIMRMLSKKKKVNVKDRYNRW